MHQIKGTGEKGARIPGNTLTSRTRYSASALRAKRAHALTALATIATINRKSFLSLFYARLPHALVVTVFHVAGDASTCLRSIRRTGFSKTSVFQTASDESYSRTPFSALYALKESPKHPERAVRGLMDSCFSREARLESYVASMLSAVSGRNRTCRLERHAGRGQCDRGGGRDRAALLEHCDIKDAGRPMIMMSNVKAPIVMVVGMLRTVRTNFATIKGSVGRSASTEGVEQDVHGDEEELRRLIGKTSDRLANENERNNTSSDQRS
ncbi:hypothetical protein LshimejAT787_1300800 [Lyophyllum shimeji]|uniref:Uncharacterized protein n=1 Tax=Lyophyllum shimeji TaxID=47721 RepID=A0A9P3UPU5_LYOSH|nr:hypothetical protein LshimejAT787_1300800 [Lyophyllum shimeji]